MCGIVYGVGVDFGIEVVGLYPEDGTSWSRSRTTNSGLNDAMDQYPCANVDAVTEGVTCWWGLYKGQRVARHGRVVTKQGLRYRH